MGVVSGFVMVLLLYTAYEATPSKLLVICAEILAIPTFWFGGPWLATAFMQGIDHAELLPSYVLALALCFTTIVMVPGSQLVIRLGQDIRAVERKSDA